MMCGLDSGFEMRCACISSETKILAYTVRVHGTLAFPTLRLAEKCEEIKLKTQT